MLLGNYTPLSANPGRCVTHAIPNPYKWRSSGNMYSFYTGDAVVSGETEKSSFPNGYIPPYSWVLSPKSGGLASINLMVGEGSLSGAMAKGINIDSTLNGSGVLTTNLSLIVALISVLNGSGVLTSSMVGIVQMASTLVGQGSLSSALGLLANCIADLSGSGSMNAVLRADAYMTANIYVNESEATVGQIVYAIWNAIASEYNESGTMGEKLNGAGSAGDPWTTDLSGYNTDGTAGKKLKELKNPSLIVDNEIII